MRGRTLALLAVLSSIVFGFVTQPSSFVHGSASAETAEPEPTCRAVGKAITTGPDGKIWFGQEDDREIGRLTLPAGPIDEAQLGFPVNEDIVTGSDGNLWTTWGFSPTVAIIKPDLSFEKFTLPANGATSSTSTVLGPDGNIYVLRGDDGRVQLVRITPSKDVTVFTPPIPPGGPGDMVAGPSGSAWFFARLASDASRWRLFRASYDGTTAVEVSVDPPNSTVAGPFVIDGALWYVRDYGQTTELVHVGPHGVIKVIPTTRIPWHVFGFYKNVPALGPDGRIWFGINHVHPSFRALDTTGAQTTYAEPSGYENIANITGGPDGRLWWTTASHVRSMATDGTPGPAFEIPASHGPPVACSLTPDRGTIAGGDELTIRGRGFSRATSVMLDEVPLDFTIVSDFEIRATTRPTTSGDHAITVRSPQEPLVRTTLTFRAIGPPEASSACPTDGPAEGGYWITVKGKDMDTATSVRFGDRTSTTVALLSDREHDILVVRDALSVLVPSNGVGGVRLTASSEYGTGPEGGVFVYTPLPVSADPCAIVNSTLTLVQDTIPH